MPAVARQSAHGYTLQPDGLHAALMAAPMVSRCSLCGQEKAGTAAETIAWAAAHRTDRHAHELTLTTRRRRRRNGA